MMMIKREADSIRQSSDSTRTKASHVSERLRVLNACYIIYIYVYDIVRVCVRLCVCVCVCCWFGGRQEARAASMSVKELKAALSKAGVSFAVRRTFALIACRRSP